MHAITTITVWTTDHVTFGIHFDVTRVRTWIERLRCRWNSTAIKRMRKQWKPGPFLLPFSGLGTRLHFTLSSAQSHHFFTTSKSHKAPVTTHSRLWLHLGGHFLHCMQAQLNDHLTIQSVCLGSKTSICVVLSIERGTWNGWGKLLQLKHVTAAKRRHNGNKVGMTA